MPEQPRTTGTVFLSYASQDVEAARRICESLRDAGVEVWFDADGGLEHGDEWDRKIRLQIKECMLFIPIISANTQAREEGYFRIEWDLAAERAQAIAAGVAFILPIVIDDTRESEALLPDRFRKVHWTRLPGGEVPPEVGARFRKLWSHRAGVVTHGAGAQEMAGWRARSPLGGEPPAPAGSGGPRGSAPPHPAALPSIPDFELIRPIGQGSYGDVWLARGLTGVYRAIKIVWRDRFSDAAPFEREFQGLKKFTAMSLPEASQMALLHVGQNEGAGFFYYVMELADDVETGREVNPAKYSPLTLKEVRTRRGRLPAAECVTFGVGLARALAGLHERGLVHRDIKPSNIILVGGVPKLADIGLVAETSEALTNVGTEGFMPPEGPGKPAADVFALGKLLYELATGIDREDFPRLPPGLDKFPDRKLLLKLNDIILRCCEPVAERRYTDAPALLADLLLLQAGSSARRRRIGRLALGAAAALVAVGGYFWLKRPANPASTAGAGQVKAVETPKSESQQLVDQARRLFEESNGNSSKLDAAVSVTEQALKLDPTNADALAVASQLDTHMLLFARTPERLERARSRQELAITLAPRAIEPRIAHAWFMVQGLGPPQSFQAEGEVLALSKELPNDWRVCWIHAALRLFAGRFEDAVEILEDGATKTGNFASIALTEKAVFLHMLGRYPEAEQTIDRALTGDALVNCYAFKATMELAWRGNLDGALAIASRIAVEDQFGDIGMATFERVYRWRREPANVLKFLSQDAREWINWDVGAPKAALKGEAYKALGQIESARAEWQLAVKQIDARLAATPNDRGLLEWKAYLFAELGERAEAQKLWQRARTLDRGHAGGIMYNFEKIQMLESDDEIMTELEKRAERPPATAVTPIPNPIYQFVSAADLRLNPAWDGVRELPRFKALQAKLEKDPRFSPTATAAK